AVILTAALLFVFLALGALTYLLAVALAPVSSGGTHGFFRTTNWLMDQSQTQMFAGVFVVGAIGVLLLVRRRASLGVFLVIFCLWAAPRAVHGLMGDRDRTGVVDFVTLDVAITAALVVAYFLLPRRGLERRRPELLIALVVSTSVAYAGFATSLLPTAVKSEWFWIVLAFPLVYQLLFDSRAINEAGARRAVRLLALVGVATM